MDLLTGIIKTGSALAFVLGMIFIVSLLAKKYLGNRYGIARPGPFLQVIHSISIGLKKEITLVEAGEHYLVLGVTANQISLLIRIKKESFNTTNTSQEKHDHERI
ncbi:MAG: flagellar biosynthetic protein FliO [Nitrospirae bacterium]|nr:flagellar biosynthetic protein FliO [Nitrospirota bacterium]MBI3352048.1 flagellar biosynthetic protein FliO [Nitrospirota bacterium]